VLHECSSKQPHSPYARPPVRHGVWLHLRHTMHSCIVLTSTAELPPAPALACRAAVCLPAHLLLTMCSSTGVTPGGRGAARCMSRQHQLLMSHRHTQPAASMESKQLPPESSAAEVEQRVEQVHLTGCSRCMSLERIHTLACDLEAALWHAKCALLEKGSCRRTRSAGKPVRLQMLAAIILP
jgi:hypothetical protein